MSVRLKETMAAGDVVLGLILRASRSSEIVRIAKASGHDFLFIDTQHAVYDLETIEHIAHAARGHGIGALVRVAGPDDPDMARLLDIGTHGVIVPDVETAAQATTVAGRCRFAPVGRRSVVGGGAFSEHPSLSLADAIPLVEELTVVVCMIESRLGLANVDEIAAVEGVDVLHVGANDLSAEMGTPGALDNPEVADAVAVVIAACERNGKFAGLGGDRDPQRQAAFVAAGGRFVTTQSDVNLLTAAATAQTAELRNLLEAGP